MRQQKRRDTSSSIPAAVRSKGYLGYPTRPTETPWTKHVCTRLEETGAQTVCNVMGLRVSSVPDRTMISRYGIWYVEFKGEDTEIQLNQTLWMERANRRTFAGGLGACCIVYRYPGYFQTPRGLYVGDTSKPAEVFENPGGWLLDLQALLKNAQTYAEAWERKI